MNKFRMLSGEELVTQGAKKGNTTLPEVGLKDVVPNGSWLEQKQVQNALEARRHIVEVERIEKCGSLSHAEWKEDLELAEVTKCAGGHWQYVGHNVGRHLYLHPEEALHLMEINCLQLKYNEVTVSIQQAYSLLLKDNKSLIQYKVYASLSRLGYKVLKHTYVSTEDDDSVEKKEPPSSSDQSEVTHVNDLLVKNESLDQKIDDIAIPTSEINVSNSKNAPTADNSNDTNEVINNVKDNSESNRMADKTDGSIVNNKYIVPNIESTSEPCPSEDTNENNTENDCETLHMETENAQEAQVSSSVNLCDEDSQKTGETLEVSEVPNNASAVIIQNKLDILNCRELIPSNSDLIHQYFNENLPDFYQKQIVTVKAPEEQHIPRNVFLNSTAYVLNLQNLKLKTVTPASSSSCTTYSVTDEADARIGRIRSGHSNESAQTLFNPQFYPNMRFPQQPQHYRQFYWNQFNYNWASQRPFFPSMPFRFQFFPRMQQTFRCIPARSLLPNSENSDLMRTRKRKRNNPKAYHLESIKKLAAKLKCLVASGNRQEQNIQALQRLIDTYNVRYKTRLELTDQLDVVENEVILETIDLDDDEQSSPKRKKKEEMESYDENFNALKQFSLRIKELEAKKMLSTRHKRAFSNVIRTFNKSYNADVYVDSNFNVIDRRRIVIASSSDSECTIEEVQSMVEDTRKPEKSRRLRNPFYILKQLSEKQTTIKKSANVSSRIDLKKEFEYSDRLKKMFSKYWLPSKDDFGRAEVPLKSQIKNQMDHSEDFLYQFIKSQPVKFNNWLDAKIAYWQSCKEAALKFEAHSQSESHIKLDSIINPEDCTDLRNLLKKLSVIKTKKDVQEECCLCIHFDVYNRDVPNFKKSNKPKPHFRVICIEESSAFPTGIEITTLHSKYHDDVGIVFAIVGTASISYLQINPVDLPIYIPVNNMP